MPAVRPRAIEHDVGLLIALLIAFAHQQEKRLLAAPGIAGRFLLQEPDLAHAQHARLRLDALTQNLGNRRRVALDVLAASDAGIVGWKSVFGLGGEDGAAAQRRGVHAERAEQPDVPPAPDMFADAALLIDGERQLELPGVQPRFQTDWPGA